MLLRLPFCLLVRGERLRQMIVIDDVYRIPASAPYHFDTGWDHATGYCTRSLLTLPLKNKDDLVVGILQFVNCKRDHQALLNSTNLKFPAFLSH